MSEISVTRKAALWVGVVFLLGAALGGMIGYSYAHHLVSAASTPLPEPVRRAQRGEQLTHLLNLTNAQSQYVDAIRRQKHTEANELHHPTHSHLAQLPPQDAHPSPPTLTPHP